MFRQTVAVLAVLIAGALPVAAHAAPAQPPIFGAYYRVDRPSAIRCLAFRPSA